MFLNLKYLYWTLNCPTTQSNLQIQWYPYQNCNDSFHRNEISILKFVWNHCVVLSRSVVYNSLRTHASQLTRLPSPWRFSRKKYWSGLPCPPPGDLPNPGIKPRSPALQVDALPSEPPGKQIQGLVFLDCGLGWQIIAVNVIFYFPYQILPLDLMQLSVSLVSLLIFSYSDFMWSFTVEYLGEWSFRVII